MQEDGGADASGTVQATQRRSGVVVFVKDKQRPQAAQHHRHLMQLTAAAAATGGDLVADSSSNTDSGNGTSEYSDDPSPTFINSATSSRAILRHCATTGHPSSTRRTNILIIRLLVIVNRPDSAKFSLF